MAGRGGLAHCGEDQVLQAGLGRATRLRGEQLADLPAQLHPRPTSTIR